MTRLTGSGPTAWIHRLMAREMERPTDALDLVMKQVVLPRLEYLSGVVGTIMQLPAGDPRVKRCVGSLQSQCLMTARQVPTALEKTFGPAMRDVESAIDHIADFSIGGMRSIARAE